MGKKITCSLLILFISIINVLGWGGKSHKLLTKYSWRNSTKLGNSMILVALNFEKGMLKERLNDGNSYKNLEEWLQYGAEHEDDTSDILLGTPDRSNFHFHNPLKEWSEAGLSDIHVGASGSSLWWAQNNLLQATISNDVKKARTWFIARENFYKGLIESADLELRSAYFAELFKTLGHQIHLIQDMAVPDHTRNDSHVLNSFLFGFWKKKNNSFRCIEGWAEYKAENNIGELEAIISGVIPTPLIDFSTSADSECPVPIAFLSDTKHYKISQIPLSGLDQGLAEYTNANFFSEDTIFTEKYEHNHTHWFPHPNKAESNLMSLIIPSEVVAEDGQTDLIKHIEKNGDEHLNNLVAAGYYNKYLDGLGESSHIQFFLSDLCHKEYTKKLFPRAVAYSAMLLNYFFRGEIEISLPKGNPGINPPQKDGIYSLCTNPAIGFDKISLMVRNITTENEEMKNGKIILVISYRTCKGDPFVQIPPLPSEERKYISVEYQGEVTIPRDNPLRINFNLSENPLPFDAVDVSFIVVFKGDLGAELSNAVAIGFKDVSEPTPIDLFNNSDLVCFNGNYVNYTDPALLQQVDTNHNEKIDCDQAEINIIPIKMAPLYLSFNGLPASATNFFYKFPETDSIEIFPNENYRFYFISDNNPELTSCSINVKSENIPNSTISWGGVCPVYFNSDPKDAYSYYNKLVWKGDHYEPLYAGIGKIREKNYYNILIFNNVTVPENSSCNYGDSDFTQTVRNTTENQNSNHVFILRSIENKNQQINCQSK